MTSKSLIINVDESVISCTDFRKRGWVKSGEKKIYDNEERLYGTNIIAGISNAGHLFFTLNQGRNNSITLKLFFIKLVQVMNIQNPNWRSHSVIILDNAPYHRSKESL